MAKPKFTRQELIGLLQDFNEKYGHAPVENDFKQNKVHYLIKTTSGLKQVFGSYRAALDAAGLVPYKGGYKGRSGRKAWTAEEKEQKRSESAPKRTTSVWTKEAKERWQEARLTRKGLSL